MKKEAPVERYRLVDGECEVHEYPTGVELPAGAKSLGWVQVPREATDELTFEKLRAAVCEKGGTAFSQARWLRNSGMSVAEPPVALEANAWQLAETK